MRTSRKGQWILDDPRYQFIISDGSITFLKIIRYQTGFNSLSFVYEDENLKELETTIPRNLFQRIAYPTFVDAMVAVLQKYQDNNYAFSANENQRLFEYRTYLTKYYPEKLI